MSKRRGNDVGSVDSVKLIEQQEDDLPDTFDPTKVDQSMTKLNKSSMDNETGKFNFELCSARTP